MNEQRSQQQSEQPAEAPDSPDGIDAPPITPPGHGWFQRLMSVLFIIFCFELGLFLLVYPWTGGWNDNYLAWHAFWNNGFVRGAVSGMGVVNLWIAITEVFRMFNRRRP
jgi:hypothetical protein